MEINRLRKKAIDFYSGIGGWTLGFKLAGVEVTDSYEWWEPAIKTHEANIGFTTHQVNIRELDLTNLPKKIDFLVGSPPCTQFSYSNRGGSGNVEDGLKDIECFLNAIRQVKPTFWAMENVPRVAKVLIQEVSPGGSLESFSDIISPEMIHVYNFSDFGLPQNRKRCVAGNFDSTLLASYQKKCTKKLLGNVIDALSKKRIRDPNYKLILSNNRVSEQEKEELLSREETRFNRAAKSYHPVYNDMKFPDTLEKPVRTVTATCTRVSRESIVVAEKNGFRRLTVRERGCLQGFPISYEFLGKSYSAKLKMIGNAIPPVFTYYVAHAMLGTKTEDIVPLEKLEMHLEEPKTLAVLTPPDTIGKTYPKNRTFRFAIPHLRFKSGTRFELNNGSGSGRWQVEFYFGDSKRIKSIDLNKRTLKKLSNYLNSHTPQLTKKFNRLIKNQIPEIDHKKLQSTWSGRGDPIHPFEVLDSLGDLAKQLIVIVNSEEAEVVDNIIEKMATVKDAKTGRPIALPKLKRFAPEIVAGFLVGCHFNIVNKI